MGASASVASRHHQTVAGEQLPAGDRGRHRFQPCFVPAPWGSGERPVPSEHRGREVREIHEDHLPHPRLRRRPDHRRAARCGSRQLLLADHAVDHAVVHPHSSLRRQRAQRPCVGAHGRRKLHGVVDDVSSHPPDTRGARRAHQGRQRRSRRADTRDVPSRGQSQQRLPDRSRQTEERPPLQRRQRSRHAGCVGAGKHGTHRGPHQGAPPVHRPRHHHRAPAAAKSREGSPGGRQGPGAEPGGPARALGLLRHSRGSRFRGACLGCGEVSRRRASRRGLRLSIDIRFPIYRGGSMKPAKLIAGTALLCAAAFPVSSRAQDYPSRSVLFVVPFTPGTAADSLARLVQPHLSQRWGVPVVVENRPGASGIIGIDSVAKANPDGYTYLFTSTAFGTLAAMNPKLPYDPDKSFAPVMLLGTSPLSLLVSNNFPAKTVKELIVEAKKRPGDLNYASAGTGSVFHLSMELLQHEAGTKMIHVPYKGTTGVINDLIAGHVQASMMVFQTAVPLVQGGRVRMLAVMTSQRAPGLPDVPTMVESGFPNLIVEAWTGVMVPAKTPPAVVSKFNGEVNKVLALQDVKAAAARIDVTLAGGTPETLDALVKKEIKQWTQVVQRANIKPE